VSFTFKEGSEVVILLFFLRPLYFYTIKPKNINNFHDCNIFVNFVRFVRNLLNISTCGRILRYR
jgi:hypothetical protein